LGFELACDRGGLESDVAPGASGIGDDVGGDTSGDGADVDDLAGVGLGHFSEGHETIGEGGDATATAGFEFEPSASAVLETLLPRYVESRLFAALLDAAASELANRQRAMKSATDNAEELIVKYTRKMNQVRQDAITTEIMEIIGGAEALADDRETPGELILHHLDTEPFLPLDHSHASGPART